MAETTSIEWTEATWNPVTGCSVVSPGCTNCYAMRLAGTRLRHHPSRAGLTIDSKAGPVWTGEVRFNEGWLDQPLRWKRPRRIFVCAHGDLFHESVPDEWIARVFAVMCRAKRHTFQVLTKRAERMRDFLSRCANADELGWITHNGAAPKGYQGDGIIVGWARNWPLTNVWLGVSVEDQARADTRIPHLLATPAAIRWVSCEPLLGPVDLRRIPAPCDNDDPSRKYTRWDALRGASITDHPVFGGGGIAPGKLDWVVAGGESGPGAAGAPRRSSKTAASGGGARPMHPDWARSLRDQCEAAGVPFFFKQWGEWQSSRDLPLEVVGMREQACILPDGRVREWQAGYPDARLTHPQMHPMTRVGKKAAGALLDGTEHKAWPEARP